MMIRVVVADDSLEYREALAAMIEGVRGLSLVGVARDGTELIALCDAEAPAICLTDVRMPTLDGLKALEVLRSRHPTMLLVAFSSYDAGTVGAQALAAGAHMFFTKDETFGATARLETIYHQVFGSD